MVHGIEKYGDGFGGAKFTQIFSCRGTNIFVGIRQRREHRLGTILLADISQNIEDELAHVVVGAGKLLEQQGDDLRPELHQDIDSSIAQTGIVLGVQKLDHLARQDTGPRRPEIEVHRLLANTPALISQGLEDQARVTLHAASSHGLETLQSFLFLRGMEHPVDTFFIFHCMNCPVCC